MFKRLIAIGFIFFCTTMAWFVLAATIHARTAETSASLRGRVESVWGSQHAQQPPVASVETPNGNGGVDTFVLPLMRSDLHAKLALEPRQKGLLWFSTYTVDFQGTYAITNNLGRPVHARLQFPLPARQAVYDGLTLLRDGRPLASENRDGAMVTAIDLDTGATLNLQVAYRSQGLDDWQYRFGENAGQVRDFHCTVTTDFAGVDFPDNTLAPTTKRRLPAGWELQWNYASLVSGVPADILMPAKAQPGPLAGSISTFAPVSLFFFFFLMVVITTMKRVDLHPMNYFFLACAFFAFHLLFAYLVDHISIHTAFILSSLVSIGLVVSYLRIVTGLRFALVEAGLAQFAYLVLFSYAFFFPGYTGLAVTIGSIATLFAVMQWTGRVRWAERFAPRPEPQPE